MMRSGTAVVTGRNLRVAFEARGTSVVALEDVSFTIGAGEFVCIVGPSGCGKTTLLRLVAGLLEPSSGELSLAGGSRPAMVFQEHGLFPWMSVVDNVAFGLEAQGVAKGERRRRAGELVERVGLGAFTRSYPHELSVGMRQRVGIARALLTGPDLLLMDEPFGSLDAQTKILLQEELLRFWDMDQRSVLYVTHDIDEAVLLGDRVLVMSGRPGAILDEIAIPLGRPRDLRAGASDACREIAWRIWKLLEHEVRRSLSLPPV